MTINPSANKVPVDNISPAIDLVCLLVRSSLISNHSDDKYVDFKLLSLFYLGKLNLILVIIIIFCVVYRFDLCSRNPYLQSAQSPFMYYETQALIRSSTSSGAENNKENVFPPATIGVLAQENIQTFLNGIFLDDALHIRSANVTSALQHLCFSRGGKETIKLCEYLVDRIDEAISINGNSHSSAQSNQQDRSNFYAISLPDSQLYRPYFKTLADLFTEQVVELDAVFNLTMSPLIQKVTIFWSLCLLDH